MSQPENKPAVDPARARVAHEIRNSLGAIRTAAELLGRHYRPEGREQRLFRVMIQEIDRLAEITEQELGPARPR